MTLIQRLADVEHPDSFANRMRNRRFQRFEQLLQLVPPPIRIVDLGGTPDFWIKRGWANRTDFEITTVNLQPLFSPCPHIRSMTGDVTDLARLPAHSFDIAFSNSVIEHLYTYNCQQVMADEMVRLAPRLWLQTPNFWFPVEPHFHVPGWQWLPEALRVALIRRRRCGWRGPCPNRHDARLTVREVRLLRRCELARLFTGAAIEPERFAGLVKSWIVHRGFNTHASQPQVHAAA